MDSGRLFGAGLQDRGGGHKRGGADGADRELEDSDQATSRDGELIVANRLTDRLGTIDRSF